MSVDHSEKQNRLPNKTIAHSISWANNVSLKMGVENQFENFQHKFQMMRLFQDDISLNLEAQKQGVFGGRRKYGSQKSELIEYDKTALDRIKKIWYGKTYLINKHDSRNQEKINESIFSYNTNDAGYYDEIIELPPLRDMCPLGRIDDMTWGLRLDIAVPAKYAFEGYSYEEIILFGKYFKKYADQTIPAFKDMNDVKNGNKMVSYVGRIWWKKTINILQTFWEKQHDILFVNQHRMLESEMKTNMNRMDGRGYVPDATEVE